jgi:DNA-directed RNA polymerase specialized sigma24 family protein
VKDDNGWESRLRLPSTPEWNDFRDSVVEHRKRLERALRRELVHDPRSATCRVQNVAARDLADEALCQTLDEWRSKPGGTPPFQWMLKRGMHLLDAALDRETLAAESRAEERDEEDKLVARDLMQDDEERARWLEVAGLASVDTESVPESESFADTESGSRQPDRFDGLTSHPATSSPDARMQQAETILELERAMLRLPELRRRAVAHRFLDGLDVDEISFLLELEKDEVEIELSSALATLRSELGAA